MSGWWWGGLVYAALVGPVAVVIARCIRSEDPQLVAPAPAVEWSDVAVEAEFHRLVPSFVTADSFVLDAQMNRRARGAA